MMSDSFFRTKATTPSTCRYCGSTMADQISFCGYCGNAKENSASVTQLSIRPKPSPPPSPVDIPMTRERATQSKNTYAIPVLILATLLLTMSTLLITRVSSSSASTSKSVSFSHLEDDASRWTVTTVPSNNSEKLINVQAPSLDGNALKTSLTVQHPGETTLVTRNLGNVPNVTTFELNLSFFFASTTSLQTLGFSTSQLINHQRWEWALRWSNNHNPGAPSSWQMWDGKQWQNLYATQTLSANTWHKLWLKGDIANGQVHYSAFSCDKTSQYFNQSFAPVSSPGEDQLAMTAELNGGAQGKPYDVYLDRINLSWN